MTQVPVYVDVVVVVVERSNSAVSEEVFGAKFNR